MLRRHLDAVRAFDDASLSADERIDRGLLSESIEQMLFGEEDLREDAWDPLSVVYLLGSGLFALLARDFAPWEQRGASFLGRVRGLPATSSSGITEGLGSASRVEPVSLVHLETALSQLSGVRRWSTRASRRRGQRAGRGEATEPACRSSRRPARRANAALERFGTDARYGGPAKATGDGRLGPRAVRRQAALHAGQRPGPGRGADPGAP